MPAKKVASKSAKAPRNETSRMKLAEALIVRADLQKRILQLKDRLLKNAKVQEGDRPSEDPNDLLRRLDANSAELERLIARINRTNSVTVMGDGTTISDAIARRDVLRMRSAIFREVALAGIVTQDRYTKSEVKFKSTVDVGQLMKAADELAKQHRELDARIQEMNWSAELSS